MRTLAIVCSALFATLLLVSNPVLSDGAAGGATEAELIGFNDRFNEAAANYDVQAFLSLYSKRVLWIAPGKSPVQGHETPRQTFQFLVENEGKLTHTIDNLFISEDNRQAVMIGQIDLEVEKRKLDTTGTYLFVLKRLDNDWKIVADMYNQHASE